MAKETRRLNDLSREEIQEAMKAKPVQSQRPCLWCKEVKLMKPDQSFCKAACRFAYANHARAIEKKHAMEMEKRWAIERADLLNEIESLKRQLRGEGA